MTLYRKINIVSEKILNYSYFKFASWLGKDLEFWLLFSVSKTKTPSCQPFFTKKSCERCKFYVMRKNEKNEWKIVASLDYLNRCKVLYVYVDITVLVWQKVNGANQHLSVKSLKSKTTVNCSSTLGNKFSVLIAVFHKQVNIRCSVHCTEN